MSERVLLLDVMDTLVVDPFFEVFPRVFGSDLRTLLKDKDEAAWPRFERGEIDEDEYFRTMFKDRRPVDGRAITRALFESYRYIDGIEALLDALRARGVELHLFSNYPVWSAMLDEKLRLSRHAPWTFVSWRTGQRKPDDEAFAHAVRTLARAPEELVFVDDRAVNVEAARRHGLDAVRFTDVDALSAALTARGILA